VHDKLFWVLARRLVDDWRRHLVMVRPEAVVAWHRRGWRLFWWWRSRCRLGRPRLSAEVRALIATIAREVPTWGAERIRGELLKLGIVVSRRSVQRHRPGGPARPPSQSWRTFLANPRLDGPEACRALKADPAARAAKVLLLSAATQPEDVARGLAAGADGYLTKPYRLAELLARLEQELGARPHRHDPSERRPTATPTP
jgi:hypothetical protein